MLNTILITLLVLGGIAVAYFATKRVLNEPSSKRKGRRRR